MERTLSSTHADASCVAGALQLRLLRAKFCSSCCVALQVSCSSLDHADFYAMGEGGLTVTLNETAIRRMRNAAPVSPAPNWRARSRAGSLTANRSETVSTAAQRSPCVGWCVRRPGGTAAGLPRAICSAVCRRHTLQL